MLQSALLRLVARNVQSIVDFMIALDTKLDAFLEKHDAEVSKFEKKIDDLFDTADERSKEIISAAEARSEIIFKEADEAAAKLEGKIDASKQAIEMARALKRSLPTSKAAEPTA